LRVAAGPVLVAVDDWPWLDGASAGAVVFAARRLAGEDVRFLVARRVGRDTELERVAEPAGVVRVALGPLSFGAVSGLLAARLGEPLPRRVARLVFDTCGGNPLFAVELGRAVVERGVPEIGAGLPVPAVLGELFGARVAGLPPQVRRALLAVALSHGLTGDELAAVAGPLAVEDGQGTRCWPRRRPGPLPRPGGATCTPPWARRWVTRCWRPGTGRWPRPSRKRGWRGRWRRRRPRRRRGGRSPMPPSWPGRRCG
jgi:hypothetical protein